MTELPEPSNRITTQSEFDAAPPRKRSSQGFLKEADIEFISKDLKQDLSEVRAKAGKKSLKRTLQDLQRRGATHVQKSNKFLVVTDGTLDDWVAQNLNLSLDNIDHEKISDLAPSVQARLKKYIQSKPSKLNSGRPKGQPTLMDRLMQPTGTVERKRFKQKVNHQVDTYKNLDPKVLYVHKDNLKYYKRNQSKIAPHTGVSSMMGETSTSFHKTFSSPFKRPRSSIEHDSRREKVIRNIFRRQVVKHPATGAASPSAKYELVSRQISPRDTVSTFSRDQGSTSQQLISYFNMTQDEIKAIAPYQNFKKAATSRQNSSELLLLRKTSSVQTSQRNLLKPAAMAGPARGRPKPAFSPYTDLKQQKQQPRAVDHQSLESLKSALQPPIPAFVHRKESGSASKKNQQTALMNKTILFNQSQLSVQQQTSSIMESEGVSRFARDQRMLSLAQERRLFKSNSKLNRFMSSSQRKRPVTSKFMTEYIEAGSSERMPSPHRSTHHHNTGADFQNAASESESEEGEARYAKQILQVERVVADIPPIKNKIAQPKQADFWLQKGYLQSQRAHFESAIDCYKQGLEQERAHFPCLFNLACCYQKMKRLRRALRRFYIAAQARPDSPQAYYAISLCAYKLGLFEEALKNSQHAQELMETLRGAGRLDPPEHHRTERSMHLVSTTSVTAAQKAAEELRKQWFMIAYISALCHRRLKQYTEARDSFKVIQKEISRRHRETIKQYVFGSLLLPFTTERLAVQNTLVALKGIVGFFGEKPVIPDSPKREVDSYRMNKGGSPVGRAGKRAKSRGYGIYESEDLEPWESPEELAKYSFFCRYSQDKLRKEVIPAMDVRELEEGEILFLEKEEVGVVLEGVLLMRSHRDSVVAPALLGKLTSGDIIGYTAIDEGMSKLHENWMTAHTAAFIAVFKQQDFAKIWEAQKSTEKELEKSLLQTHQIFRQFSLQTLYLLCYELLERRFYCANQLLAVQTKGSPFNSNFAPTFQNKVSAIAIGLKRHHGNEREKHLEVNIPSRMRLTHANPSPHAQSTAQADFAQSLGSSPTNASRRPTPHLAIEESALMQPKIRVHVTDDQQQDGGPSQAFTGRSSLNESMIILGGDHEEQHSTGVSMERGLFIISKGRADVINPSDGYYVTELGRGDFFGEDAYFHEKGFCHFGDVISASTEGEPLSVLFVSGANLRRLPIWEIEKLSKFSQARPSVRKVTYTCELRYQKKKKRI